MSLPGKNAFRLWLSGSLLLMLHFANVAPAVGDPTGPNSTSTDETSCTGVASFHVISSTCSRFWVCLNETKHGFYCPSGTSFLNVTGECEPYSMVPRCINETDRVEWNVQRHVPTVPAAGDELNKARNILGLPPVACGPDFSIPKSQCTGFWVCFGINKLYQPCPSGKAFSAEKKKCDLAANVEGCHDGLNGTLRRYNIPLRFEQTSSDAGPFSLFTPPSSTTIAPRQTECDTEGTIFESQCTRFLVCLNGMKTYIPCPAGHAFNVEKKNCDVIANVKGCTEGIAGIPSFHNPPLQMAVIHATLVETELECDTELIIPESDCRGFWICLRGRKIRVLCNPDEAFNLITSECEPYATVPGCTSGVPGLISYIRPPLPLLENHDAFS